MLYCILKQLHITIYVGAPGPKLPESQRQAPTARYRVHTREYDLEHQPLNPHAQVGPCMHGPARHRCSSYDTEAYDWQQCRCPPIVKRNDIALTLLLLLQLLLAADELHNTAE
jgi:hypothetical protein